MPNTLTTEIANGASSNNRAETNRENAKSSTGPRTVAGKQRSSLNALRHGLTGQTVVLPSDDLVAYERHCKGFFNQYQPKNPTEVQIGTALLPKRPPSRTHWPNRRPAIGRPRRL